MRVAALLSLLVLLSAAVAPAQRDRTAELRAQGQEALAKGDHEVALELFEASRLMAKEAGDAEAEAKALFQLAVTEQLQAEREFRSGNAPKDPEKLARSLSIYERAVEINPSSAASWHNMAQLHTDLGDEVAARRAFARSAEVASPERKPFYLLKYADFLLEAGHELAAADEYGRLVVLAPDDPAPHQLALELYWAAGADGAKPLLEYLWRLVRAGEVLKSQDAALTALEGAAEGYSPREQQQLLAVVAASLAELPRPPSAIADSPTASRLDELGDHPLVGRGAQELLALYRTPGDCRGGFVWWGSHGLAYDEPEVGVWPRDAFRRAMRRVGAWYERREDYGVAEACYWMAAELSHDEPDPGAYRDLAKLYLARGEIDRLQELDATAGARLYSGKNEAYRRGQLEKIYEYHVSLGQVWGALAKAEKIDWGSTSDSRTALFQLERAIETGKMLDDKARQSGAAPEERQTLHLDPAVVELYALGLEKTLQTQRADEVKREAAARFTAAGDEAAAEQVLRRRSDVRPERDNARKYRAVPLEKKDDG